MNGFYCCFLGACGAVESLFCVNELIGGGVGIQFLGESRVKGERY